MNGEFTRKPRIEHVAQPADSELCFAADLAAVCGESLDDAHAALLTAHLSEADGSTAPPMREITTLAINDQQITLRTIQSYREEAEDTPGVIELIEAELQEGNPVLLLHKKTADPNDDQHHWILLTDYQGSTVEVMDPSENGMRYDTLSELSVLIDRSLAHSGVWAYAIGVAPS